MAPKNRPFIYSSDGITCNICNAKIQIKTNSSDYRRATGIFIQNHRDCTAEKLKNWELRMAGIDPLKMQTKD